MCVVAHVSKVGRRRAGVAARQRVCLYVCLREWGGSVCVCLGACVSWVGGGRAGVASRQRACACCVSWLCGLCGAARSFFLQRH